MMSFYIYVVLPFPHGNSSSENILQFTNCYPVMHIYQDFFICKYMYGIVSEIYHTCCVHFCMYLIFSTMSNKYCFIFL